MRFILRISLISSSLATLANRVEEEKNPLLAFFHAALTPASAYDHHTYLRSHVNKSAHDKESDAAIVTPDVHSTHINYSSPMGNGTIDKFPDEQDRRSANIKTSRLTPIALDPLPQGEMTCDFVGSPLVGQTIIVSVIDKAESFLLKLLLQFFIISSSSSSSSSLFYCFIVVILTNTTRVHIHYLFSEQNYRAE
jgi:hypothetical protein